MSTTIIPYENQSCAVCRYPIDSNGLCVVDATHEAKGVLPKQPTETWCDDCHGYTHMPWCPSYRAASEISNEEYHAEQPAPEAGELDTESVLQHLFEHSAVAQRLRVEGRCRGTSDLREIVAMTLDLVSDRAEQSEEREQ